MLKPYYQDEWATIYHGDCREILPQLESVDLVLTDPPYGIGYGKYESHDDSPAEYGQLMLDSVFAAEKLVRDGWVCVYQAAKKCREWHGLFPREWRLIALPKTFVQILPGIGPTWATDYALLWPVGKPSQRGVNRDWFVQETSDMSKRPPGHPCPRPLNGTKYLAQTLADVGDTILDPFMGSGTTLRAAKDLGIKSIGIEIEEKYCEIAVKRLRQESLIGVLVNAA